MAECGAQEGPRFLQRTSVEQCATLCLAHTPLQQAASPASPHALMECVRAHTEREGAGQPQGPPPQPRQAQQPQAPYDPHELATAVIIMGVSAALDAGGRKALEALLANHPEFPFFALCLRAAARAS